MSCQTQGIAAVSRVAASRASAASASLRRRSRAPSSVLVSSCSSSTVAAAAALTSTLSSIFPSESLSAASSHRFYRTTTPSLLSDAEGPKTKQLKVKKKEKKSAGKGKGKGSASDRAHDLLLRFLDSPTSKPPAATPEEMARRFDIGLAYNVGTTLRHNKLNHDLACKIHLKNHAISMLPKKTMWREEALKIDDDEEGEGPPYYRNIPVWTAPIPGFDPDQFAKEDD